MKYLIDTNIFLRIFVKEDKTSHQECIELLSKIKQRKIDACTSSLVLAEVAWSLKSFYKSSKEDVVRCVSAIINTPGMKIIDGYQHSLALQMYGDHKAKYIDAVLASIPNVLEKRLAIVSYDKDFDKFSVLRVKPGEVV